MIRQRLRALAPQVDQLEGRVAPGSLPPTVLEQVFLERINDFRATLRGVNARPFALLPELNGFVTQAGQSRNINAFKNALDRAHVPWNRRNSFTSGEFRVSFGTPSAPGAAGVTETAEQLVEIATTGPRFGPWPLVGDLRNALYQQHRVTGLRIDSNGADFTVRDLSVSYKSNAPMLTGVVYRDTNSNGRYDAEEGVGNVTLSAGKFGIATNWQTGGYTLPLNVKRASIVTVIATSSELSGPIVQTVRVTPGSNSRLNFVLT